MKFMVDYDYKGRQWMEYLNAENWKDARSRLDAIRKTGNVEGRLPTKKELREATAREITTRIDEANRRQQRRTRREAPPDDDAAERLVTKLLQMKAGEPPS